ncbi:Regulatory protein PchR [compost metagenome]
MVSFRCKLFVEATLEKMGIPSKTVELGIVETQDDISSENLETLRKILAQSGLELLEDKKRALVVQIRDLLLGLINNPEELPNVNYSDYLSEKLNQDYTYLSNVFSEAKGITVQEFIIRNKVERVKELLKNEELSLTDISFKLNYSSVAHLSNQFKKNTGVSPSSYRQLISEGSQLRN